MDGVELIGGGAGSMVVLMWVVNKLLEALGKKTNGRGCNCNTKSYFERLVKLGEDQLTELRAIHKDSDIFNSVAREHHIEMLGRLERLLSRGD